MDSDSESKLISLVSQLRRVYGSAVESKTISLIIQIISLVKSMDLDAQPKPESKFMSLVTQTTSVFNSMDFDSLPKPLSNLISFISQRLDSDQKPESDPDFMSLLEQTLEIKPDPELTSLTRQIVSVTVSMNPKLKKLISLCPQVKGYFDVGGKSEVAEEEFPLSNGLWNCFLEIFEEFRFKGEEDSTHFRCRDCNDEYHKNYEKAPVKIKHLLHQKHTLQLVLNMSHESRECYCCDDDLKEVIYCCLTCDFAMNIVCSEKALNLSIPHSKWHEHPLALFPRKASLTCNVCALAHSDCPFYVCPPCDFVVHLKCIKLPRVIRISRHHHRIYFNSSFEEGDWSCFVCRKKMDNDYGGYSCIRDGCLYAAHSRCATQRNVWDGIDLEGQLEEIEEVVEPFVRISNGIIRHFSHDHHHLRLDENTCIDYDENRQCQACITPIYFGNFYSCVQCDFVLHETCANLPRKTYHPIHPHQLTLAPVRDVMDYEDMCSACKWFIPAGLFYECGKEQCSFNLHVKCATISEPLLHKSHRHPLFLTSKPGERRECRVCSASSFSNGTFNCIECNWFALCFECAVVPQKVMYKHDKHILNLSYGHAKTNTLNYWCETCETKIDPEERFYMCDEHCCVTLHMECLIGRDLYMKPGSTFSYYGFMLGVMSNNHHMSRPICLDCKKRCSQKIVFQYSGSKCCSLRCLRYVLHKRVANAIA